MRQNRVTLPVLAVLVAVLAAFGVFVYRETEEPTGEDAADAADADGLREPEGRGAGAWRHYRWPREGAEAPPGPTPARDDEQIPTGGVDDESYDPQMWAMRRSFALAEDAGTPLPFAPLTREATLVSAEGRLPVSPGASCSVRVLPVRTRAFNCLVRVACEGHVLYPNPEQTAGYVPCQLEEGRPVSASDDGHSALDGDPRISLDLRAGTVSVSDAGDGATPFSATLRLR